MTPGQWLRQNDRKLWVERPKVHEARERCESDTGVKLSPREFRELRDENCEFCFCRHFGRPMYSTALTERNWSKVSAFIRTHREELIGQPIEFFVRYLRSNGVPANESILRGCSAFRELAK